MMAPTTTFDLNNIDPDIILELILQSNDVNLNPGPMIQDERLEKIEKKMEEIQKELRSLKKSQDENARQLNSVTRSGQQKSKTDTAMKKMSQEVDDIRETLNAQVTLMRRQRAEVASISHEVKSVKKINLNQKNELRHLSTATINDVKSLKDDYSNGLKVLHKEKQGLDAQTVQYNKLKQYQGNLESEQETIRKDLEMFKESYKAQVISLRQYMEELYKELNEHKIATEQVIESHMNKMMCETGEARQHLEKVFEDTKRLRSDLVDLRHLVSIDFERGKQELQSHKEESKAMMKAMEDEIRQEMLALKATAKHESDQEIRQEMEAHLRKSTQDLQSAFKSEMTFFQRGIKAIEREVEQIKANQRLEVENVSNFLQDTMQAESRKLLKAITNLSERMDDLDAMYDDIEDRVFEIDKNRKNNLVFYGVKGEETDSDDCERIIKGILTHKLLVTREMPLTKVTRVWNGPSFRGFKPIQVSFQLFKDKEEVLRKANQLLRGSNIYVTEDFSRKVRQHREELIRFARELRSKDPTCRCHLRYDRLHVENEVFLFNEIEGKVEKMLIRPKAFKGHHPNGIEEPSKARSQALPASAFHSTMTSQAIQTAPPRTPRERRALARTNTKHSRTSSPSMTSQSPFVTSSDDDWFEEDSIESDERKTKEKNEETAMRKIRYLEPLPEETTPGESSSAEISSVSSVELSCFDDQEEENN